MSYENDEKSATERAKRYAREDRTAYVVKVVAGFKPVSRIDFQQDEVKNNDMVVAPPVILTKPTTKKVAIKKTSVDPRTKKPITKKPTSKLQTIKKTPVKKSSTKKGK